MRRRDNQETEPLVAELTKMDLATVTKIPHGFPVRELIWDGYR